MKVNLKNSWLLIETMVELLQHDQALKDVLMLCKNLFKNEKIDLALDALQNGTKLEEVIALLVEDTMFLRFFSLYIQSHSLATSLYKSMELCKKKEKMIHTSVQLLTYPCTLILTLLLFSFFAIVFVEPRLEELYASFQVKTSLLQKITLNTITLLPFLFILFCFVVVLIFYRFYKDMKVQNINQIQKWMHFSLFKFLIQKYYSIQFCLYYKELIMMNKDLLTILQMIEQSEHNLSLKLIAFELKRKLKEGEKLDQVIDHFDYFEPYFCLLFKLTLYYHSGNDLLDRYYETTLHLFEIKIKQITQAFVFCLYGFIGFYIVGIYFNLVLPMMNIIEQI